MISDKDLVRFSTHSLRIGACVLLHTNENSPDYIKLYLRWRSDYYKDYLRDVTVLAVAHADAIHKVSTAVKDS